MSTDKVHMHPDDRDPRCGNCRYWLELPVRPSQEKYKGYKGRCLRYPPPSNQAKQPATLFNEWCGEYRYGLDPDNR